MIQAFRNKWHNNYWDDWIGIDHKIIALLFPKIIFGILIDKTNIPLINFDWHPAKQSYNIKINN